MDIILITVFSGVIAILSILGIAYIVESVSKHKKIKLEVGDIILNRYYQDNPFIDTEWLYETVEEVLKNEKGIIYFKSYTSDKNGVKVCSQNKFSEEHTTGREYVSQYWTKVNHINL